ncbi:MAG TPA: hypothetical protein VEQ63_12400 [Bryobacteraceae bacterium]|nr:hypothetical protein [Bryobacteraceae bacterium]
MRSLRFTFIPLVAVLFQPAFLLAEKLTDEDRVEIIRGMTAEYATVKTYLPRSKKPLVFKSTGEFDKSAWWEVGKEMGPAARVGDLIQVTKIKIEDDKIILELNGGMKSGRKWYQNVEVGVGGSTRPVSSGQNTAAPGGTSIALEFGKDTPPLKAAEIKAMLAPILDFERRSATEQAVDLLPPEIKAAVKEKRAIEGMDRDQVIMALGKPRTKVRETKEGLDEEDWIYGHAPGKVTFVTFANGKVVRVKEAYAGLGGQTAPSLKPPI